MLCSENLLFSFAAPWILLSGAMATLAAPPLPDRPLGRAEIAWPLYYGLNIVAKK